MYGSAFGLIAAVTTLALATPAPIPDASNDPDFALATAGLRPFTAETDNRSLADFYRHVHPLKADLVITRVTLSPAQPKVGEMVAATIYYKNIGGKRAQQFYLRQEPGTLGEGGFGLGGDFARLEPGEEKQYSWGVITATTAGAHTLTFSIDPEGSVDESNRRNNSFQVTVQVAAPSE